MIFSYLLAMALAVVQLQLPSGGLGEGLPQIVEARYASAPIAAGREGRVVVSLEVQNGYLINRVPQMQLTLETVAGLSLPATEFLSPTEDPKSTDSYYVDVPDFTVRVEGDTPGRYEIPGELVYFFCSKADGFCSRQIIAVNVPVTVR